MGLKSLRFSHHGRGDASAALRSINPDQKALKVMMVRVSTMPGIGCTFSPTK